MHSPSGASRHFFFFITLASSVVAPVSSIFGCERIAPVTHMDQAIGDNLPLP